MGQTQALKPLFNDIAAAIHEKDGQTDGIAAKDFPARIRAIPSGGIGNVFLESIEITTPPSKTAYLVGESFDPTGMVVLAKFSNGQNLYVNHSSLSFLPSGPLEANVSYVTVNFQWGIKMASASVPISVTSAVIFGVCWDYGNPPTALTRLAPETDPNGLVTASVNSDPVPAIGTGPGSSPFDSFLPWSGMEEWNIVDGEAKYKKGDPEFSRENYDTMVYIPEFWYRCIDDPDNQKRYWYVSGVQTEGVAKHPGSGKYVARYITSGGYVSKSGLSPLVNITRSQARTGSTAKGNGWHQFDFASYCAVSLLYLVEFADWDSQAKIGTGASSAASVGGTDSMIYHTGSSENGDTQYRGIENLWKFIYQFLDGINSYNREAFICLDPSAYKDSETSNGYASSGVSFPISVNTYIKALGFSEAFPWAFIPSAGGGAANTYVPDQTGGITGHMFVQIGGAAASSASSCGIFMVMAYSGVSNPQSSAIFGSRLVYDPNLAAQEE